MMKHSRLFLLIALAISALHGCSIRQNVRPVESTENLTEVCVLKNNKVRDGFLKAYVKALRSKGYQVRILEENASLIECPITSTYSANWAWDMALYMRYAEIKVYKNAALAGEAIYDSTWGSARLDKFIDAEAKIRELTDQLFPDKPPLL